MQKLFPSKRVNTIITYGTYNQLKLGNNKYFQNPDYI